MQLQQRLDDAQKQINQTNTKAWFGEDSRFVGESFVYTSSDKQTVNIANQGKVIQSYSVDELVDLLPEDKQNELDGKALQAQIGGSEFIDDKNQVLKVNLTDSETGTSVAETTVGMPESPEPPAPPDSEDNRTLVDDPGLNDLLTGKTSILDCADEDMIKDMKEKLGTNYEAKIADFQTASQSINSLTSEEERALLALYIKKSNEIESWSTEDNGKEKIDYYMSNGFENYVAMWLQFCESHSSITSFPQDIAYILLYIYSAETNIDLYKDYQVSMGGVVSKRI